MALVQCSECGKQISDRAQACPACGNPMTAAPVKVATDEHGVVTTQQTGKHYKGMMLVGTGLICMGVVSCVAGMENTDPGYMMASGTLTMVGLFVFLYARIAAWWRHG